MRLRSWLAVAGTFTVAIGVVAVGELNASAATTTTTIEDTSATGVSYAGTWSACSGNCAKAADNSFRWTSTVNSSVTVSFTGNHVALFGMKEPWDNIATVSVDNGATTDVDYYASVASATTVQVYSSPALSQGNHTVKLTMTSRRNPASTGGNSITFDKAVVTSGTTTTSAYLSGLPWSSGVAPQDQTTSRVSDFVTFRGANVDNVVLFPARDNWSAELGSDLAGGLPSGFDAAKQDLVVTLPLWPGDKNVNDIGTQQNWTDMANKIKGLDANAYVRLGWEMNLPGWAWKVGDGTKPDYNGVTIPDNRAAWQADFIKAAQWLKAAAPGLRLVWNPNYGGDQTCTNCTRTIFQNVKQYVDVYAIDTYDAWNPDLGTAGTTEHLQRLTDTRDYAAANGKKWAVPEWGLGCNVTLAGRDQCQWQGHAGGDNPQFIHDYLTFFRNNPSALAFESYFDEPGDYIRSSLEVGPIGPNAPAKYRADIAAYKIS